MKWCRKCRNARRRASRSDSTGCSSTEICTVLPAFQVHKTACHAHQGNVTNCMSEARFLGTYQALIYIVCKASTREWHAWTKTVIPKHTTYKHIIACLQHADLASMRKRTSMSFALYITRKIASRSSGCPLDLPGGCSKHAMLTNSDKKIDILF